MISLQLVWINGRLVGRRFQDRWNLDSMTRPFLGYRLCETTSIGDGAGVARLRQCLKENGFRVLMFGDNDMLGLTDRDRRAFIRPGQTFRPTRKLA